MTAAALVLMAVLGVFVGLLIGGVGIGGVLLVPGLAYLFGLPVHTAIAAAMFGYIFSGAAGAAIYARHGSIRWPVAGWILAGAAPAAFVGSAVVSVTPGRWLELLIALLVIFAGVNAVGKGFQEPAEPTLGAPVLVLIGAVTGLGSALTGTGGPLVLIPLAIGFGFPALTAVGLSQAVQLPIAALATAGNLTYGALDWTAGIVLAAALSVGAAGGAKFAHVVPREFLRPLLAWLLIAVGLFLTSRLAWRVIEIG
ncbi:MAG: sulfite exporter TauE/SafE family protein [Alphaproteobacteria bacterium]